MTALTIDINCDMAEGVDNEGALMPFISSANIACGYHAGDKALMKKTIDLCLIHNVAIGAHPSFRDRENFGRTNTILPPHEVSELVTDQLDILARIATAQGGKLHHVKPHGALYNMAAKDPVLANAIAIAVRQFDKTLVYYGLSQSAMIDEAKKMGLKTANEVFADRTYQADGSLTPRTHPNALIQNEREAVEQATRLIKENKVVTVDGHEMQLKADTICLHGDGKHAVEFARLIFSELQKAHIHVKRIA